MRKLDALHLYDCLRANKSMMAWGVEARVPFLDLEFLDVAMSMDAEHKMHAGPGQIEKAVLREAFDGALPDEILWRQKEQFSDGVGYGWIDCAEGARRERTSATRSWSRAAQGVSRSTRRGTKEALLLPPPVRRRPSRATSCAHTVPGGKSIACSSPAAIAWDAAFAAAADPSGRAIAGVHVAALSCRRSGFSRDASARSIAAEAAPTGASWLRRNRRAGSRAARRCRARRGSLHRPAGRASSSVIWRWPQYSVSSPPWRTLATAITCSSPDFSFAGGIWISLLPLPLSSSGNSADRERQQVAGRW